ncbi:MAG TPA: DUF559 domain-containing protein [Kofleriaceae bacterium]|nr:DUF559 domain-containing protein [Kofleriaceae bacterium]
MKHPGGPRSAPSWYRERPPSPIEESFAAKLDELANAISREQWFGDPQHHARYRVDFLLKDARLIVELDGHAFHSTKEQLEKDAKRQRYLTRAGYAVIRFTGREVFQDAANCVAQLRTLYRERIALTPVRYRALYVDRHFLTRSIAAYARQARAQYPERGLSAPSEEAVILHALEWLHEKSFVSVFVFHAADDDDVPELDGAARDFPRGEVRFSLQREELYSVTLSEHLAAFTHLYDDVSVVADDSVYAPALLDLAGNVNTKLIRKANFETSFRGTDLVRVRWQDIDYVIGSAMGLESHEM